MRKEDHVHHVGVNMLAVVGLVKGLSHRSRIIREVDKLDVLRLVLSQVVHSGVVEEHQDLAPLHANVLVDYLKPLLEMLAVMHDLRW